MAIEIIFDIPYYEIPELDKPWPEINPPYPDCKLIFRHSCYPDIFGKFDNGLFHTWAGTLEEACFDAIEESVYTGEYEHRNFKKVCRRHRKEDYIALTADNQLIWLRTKTNKMWEVPRVMEKWTVPQGAKYFYIGAVEHPDPEHLGRYLFDADERNLHQRLLRMAKDKGDFNFYKISTQYAHRAEYLFGAVYDSGDVIPPEDQAVIDALNAFPKDDPLAFYDECMKHIPYEAYTVDRAGNRTGSYWAAKYFLGKGIADFLNPETYRKMIRFTNAYEWERYSSDMEDDNDFGNLYEYSAGDTSIRRITSPQQNDPK